MFYPGQFGNSRMLIRRSSLARSPVLVFVYTGIRRAELEKSSALEWNSVEELSENRSHPNTLRLDLDLHETKQT